MVQTMWQWNGCSSSTYWSSAFIETNLYCTYLRDVRPKKVRISFLWTQYVTMVILEWFSRYYLAQPHINCQSITHNPILYIGRCNKTFIRFMIGNGPFAMREKSSWEYPDNIKSKQTICFKTSAFVIWFKYDYWNASCYW